MITPVERLTAALAGRYEIERELGQGGMATVYLAQDVRHHRKVALKVLRPELSAILGGERFLHEIRTTANLQHPHILPLHDSGEADGLVFYVMPYVQGESLRQRIDRDKQLPVSESVRIACEVASALDYAHRQGVIHRDIKPENILLHDGQALVADFGIALAVSSAGGASRMTETGMSLGTPHYMSPEQAMGEREINARSDIYALGCVLYEMLAGEPPFTGPTAQAIIARVVTEEPRSLRAQRKSVPDNVEEAVQTALAKIPADRFSTAAQFADALSRTDYASSSTRVTRPARPSTASTRRRALLAAPWLLFAAALAPTLWRSAQAEPEQPVTRHRIVLWQQIGPTSVLSRYLGVSDDGRTIVYGDTTGGFRLWLKESAALNAVPLPGTTEAVSPTFSPDGQWIAFTAKGKLMKIPRTGGLPIFVGDSASAWSGVAWLDNGTILYGGRHGHLLSVSEAGGTFRTVLDPDSAQRGVSSVSGLPGGGAALVTICRPGCDDPQILSLDLKTGKKTLLVTDAINGWLLDGDFIFVRPDGGVFAAPFHRGNLSLDGSPVPLFDGVRASPIVADMALSPSGTALFISGVAGRNLEELVWVSRSGVTSVVDSGWSFEPGGNPWGLALSPDGSRLAIGARVNGRNDIWVKEFDGGALRRLTFDGSNTKALAWTPDGSSVIYTSITSGSSDVRMRRADGTGEEEVAVNLERGVFDLALTNDPALFIVRTGAPPSRDLLLYRAGKADPLVATEFEESAPTLSRDGRWLAYVSDETGADEIYVRSFPDVNGGKWQVSRTGGRQPYWAHNGRELFYVNQAQDMIAAAVVTGPAFRITGQRQLFSTRGLQAGGRDRWYDVTADDGKFIFPRRLPEKDAASEPALVLVQNLGAEVRRALGRKP